MYDKFIIYTFVDPYSNDYCKFIVELGNIIGNELVNSEVVRYTREGKPSILALTRDELSWSISGQYRMVFGPGDGKLTHISQVDNPLFLEHISVVKQTKKLKL